MYVATLVLDGTADDPSTVLMHNSPGRSVTVHPVTGRSLAAFIFRSPPAPGLDHRDLERCKRVVLAAYAGGGWRLPELLDRVYAAEDLYFDAVSQVRLAAWSRGRVGLLGDAATCASLLGDGSSMAIAGAATLADALASGPDVAVALGGYEAAHRRLVESRQRAVVPGAAFLVPATRAGLTARNLALRLVPRKVGSSDSDTPGKFCHTGPVSGEVRLTAPLGRCQPYVSRGPRPSRTDSRPRFQLGASGPSTRTRTTVPSPRCRFRAATRLGASNRS
jgi:2-polyprenyl-6-methoxyphenol hydroxylase-like FAD-dependent oxidoreductase